MKRARSPEDSDSSPQPSEKKPKKSKKQSTLSSLIMSTSEAEASKSWKQTSFPSSTIKILSWNINGIRAVLKKKDLQKLIAKEDPTILCLNETKIDSEKLEQEGIKHLFPKHYLQYWNCVKPPKKGYAGTAIFSKVRPLSVQYDIGVQQHDLEGRTITLQFKSFYLVACYVPNAGQKLDRLGYRVKKWDADFQNYIQNLEKTGKPVILCGDLNVAHHEIDISNPKGNTRSAGFTVEERAEFTKFLKKGFTDTFRKLYPKTVTLNFAYLFMWIR
jgi:exodeoxyribonuclease III